MPRLRGTILNIPNIISMARIVAVPVFVIVMMAINLKHPESPTGKSAALWAFWIYVGASISDLIDGYYARRYNITSDLGKFLDPLADKLLNLAALIMMIPLHWIPAWLVMLLIAREVTITTLRGAAASEGQEVIEASKWGKYKTAFGNVGTAALVLHYPYLNVQWNLIGWVCMVIFTAFSVGSGAHYCYHYFAYHVKNKK
ncbi:MAG: CDP-diacylglycerol--glycerol-3-phosphate 3-phosphatidyltransferase [Deltaproteobacteria bacterium CG11_big_fil_rev_8_21_14_0_20_47_16]|nr:MAG: CDP-diacylglycerol--glycerol-3-phosphate 3-phosphatidyltransferase [Deltaproteobacteria bacterium CG11_big_fil_rev_8_21_14_0_20_47_16]